MNALRIIVPAYNEEARIEPCLRDFCGHFAKRALIVVVTNGCTDGTAGLVSRLQREYSNLVLLDVAAPIGKGGAVRAGLKTGLEEWVGFVDADHSFSAAEYDRMWQRGMIEKGDAVIASRYIAGSVVSPKPTLMRRFASRVFNTLVKLTLGLPCTDTQCGAKIFRRDLIRRVVASLTLANFAFDIDLLYAAHRLGARIVEHPVVLSDRIGSTIRLAPTSLRMAAALLRLRLEHSPVSRLPYLDFLAADAIIPIHRKPSVLLLSDGDSPVHAAVVDALTGDGVMEVEVAPFGVRRTFLGRLAARLGIFLWYVFGSHRRYKAIVEIVSPVPWSLPYISVKPVYVVGDTAVLSPLARLLYRAYRRAHFRTTLASPALELRLATMGKAAFEDRGEESWVLHYPGSAADQLETIELQ